MAQNNTSKIEVILAKNNALISQLAVIFRAIRSEIETSPEDPDMSIISSLRLDSKVINKKIKDNLITISDFLAKNTLDYSYYEGESSKFLKRTYHLSNTIPTAIISGTTITADVLFRNIGMFFSWTNDKGVILEVKLMDNDNNEVSVDDFPLDVNLAGNEPGDENINEDYLKEKLFQISVNITPLPPGEYYFILTIKDSTFRYYDSFKVNVTIM